MLVDHVYLKPRTRIDIVLQIAPTTDQGTSFLESPSDRALFNTVRECIKETVNKEVGYEALMAHLEFQVKKCNDMGLHLSVEAFSDKILPFTASLIDMMIQCAATDESGYGGIDRQLVANALERQHRKFKNYNLDVDVRCNNNRLQYLMPDYFHASQMEHALKDTWHRYAEESEGPSGPDNEEAQGAELMSPSTFLRERMLGRISAI